MDRPEFARLMAGLASTTHKTYDAPEIEFWFAALSDVPDEALRQAFFRCAATGDDWPSVAKLRALADEQSHGQHLTAGEAFARLRAAVRRYGSYQPEEGMASLDEVTRRALSACGGWPWACEVSAQNRQVLAAQFSRAYESIITREQEHRRTPEHLRPAITAGSTDTTDRAKLRGEHPALRVVAESIDADAEAG